MQKWEWRRLLFSSHSVPPAPKPCSGFMSPNSRRNAVRLCEPAEGERTVGSAWGRGAGTFPGLRVSWRCEPDVAAAGFGWRAVTTPASTPHTHTTEAAHWPQGQQQQTPTRTRTHTLRFNKQAHRGLETSLLLMKWPSCSDG